jgi:hypothetical protein
MSSVISPDEGFFRLRPASPCRPGAEPGTMKKSSLYSPVAGRLLSLLNLFCFGAISAAVFYSGAGSVLHSAFAAETPDSNFNSNF